MLNAAPITDAIVSALQAISDLAAAMTVVESNQPVCRIYAHHYRLGAEYRLAERIYKMPAPSMLVAWDGDLGGNFNGQTIWKHRFNVYFRMGNAAGLSEPVGYEDLWSIVCNQPPAGSEVNIRYMQLYPGLDIMDTPSVAHALDEDLQDRFVGTFVIPEIGDN
jgi:hypothetical protein